MIVSSDKGFDLKTKPCNYQAKLDTSMFKQLNFQEIMKNLLIVLIAVILFACTKKVVTVSEWRGPNRSGVYNETNLLKQWPAEGPKLLWTIDSTGHGFGSPVIAGNQLFITEKQIVPAFYMPTI